MTIGRPHWEALPPQRSRLGLARPLVAAILLVTPGVLFGASRAGRPAPGSGAPVPSGYACPTAAVPPNSPLDERLAAPVGNARDRAAELIECLAAVETPVIEPASTPGSYRVTFLYSADASVRSVRLDSLVNAVLIEGIERDLESLGRLRRIGGTDLWHLSVELPAGLRAPYRFEVLGQDGSAELVLDPRNPRVYEEDWTPNFQKSELVLPGAAAQPWRARARAQGSWETHEVGGRDVWVYSPEAVASGETAPGSLVLALGTMTFHNILPTGRIIDHLVEAEGLAPPLLIAVDAVEESEAKLYEPEADYLADLLVPWARSRFEAPADSTKVVVTGTSRRGLIASIVAARRPEAIGKVLSLSGSYYWSPEGCAPEWFARHLAGKAREDLHLYLTAGTLETVVTARNRGHYMLATNQHLRDVLVAKGYPHLYEEFVGVHDELGWQDGFVKGLTHLLGGESR